MIRSYFIRILMIIWTFHGVKKGAKIRKVGCELWDIDPWSNFCDPHWELICRNKWQLATSGISISPEIAVGTHFYARHGTKTTPVLLPTDGKAFWLLLLSRSPYCQATECTYYFIQKVTGQVGETQKRISLNINHSYYQCASP